MSAILVRSAVHLLAALMAGDAERASGGESPVGVRSGEAGGNVMAEGLVLLECTYFQIRG